MTAQDGKANLLAQFFRPKTHLFCVFALEPPLGDNLLNWRLSKQGYNEIQCGIGVDFGRALMLKAGYSGLNINEIIWMGDVVNKAAKLCHQANKDGRQPIQISTNAFDKISRQDYKDLLIPIHGQGLLGLSGAPLGHEANLVATEFNNWISEEKSKYAQRLGLIEALRSNPPNFESSFIGLSSPLIPRE